MKLRAVVQELIDHFGSDKEKANAQKIADIMVAAVGDAEIPDTKLDKVKKVGYSIQSL